MKSLYEKLSINKDTKVKRPDLYSFYENEKDIREGDKVLFIPHFVDLEYATEVEKVSEE